MIERVIPNSVRELNPLGTIKAQSLQLVARALHLDMNYNVEIIQLSGILDEAQGQRLRCLVDEIIEAGNRTVLLDCAAVDFMDSAGLGSLVAVLKQLRAKGGHLALCGTNDQVKMLFELTNMNKLFDIFASPEVFYQFILRKVIEQSRVSAWDKRTALSVGRR